MDSKWDVAFHEAGHVVPQMALGSAPELVWLKDDDHGGWQGETHMGDTWRPNLRALTPEGRQLGMVLAAGVTANSIVTRDEVGSRSYAHRPQPR